jgi:ketosteroid isomerase-like protein
MRYRHKAAAIAAIAVFSTALSSPAIAEPLGTNDDAKTITALENQMAGETDVDKLIQNYADTAIVAGIAAPGWYNGRQEIYQALKPQLANLKAVSFNIDELSVAANGNFACAAMQVNYNKTRKDGTQERVAVRQLDAFKKIDGKWQIVQQHLSVPVDQKTATPLFNAAVTSRGALTWPADTTLGPKVPLEQAKTEIMDWLTASEIPKSITEMKGYYGPGDNNIIFDWWSAREARGQQEIQDLYAPSFVGVRNLEIKIPVVNIDTDGEFGIEISKQHLRLNMLDGKSQLISFRQSDCVRRVAGRWYSFFEMGSFPVSGETGKAIMADQAGSGFN